MYDRLEWWFTKQMERLERRSRTYLARAPLGGFQEPADVFTRVLRDVAGRWEADASGRFFPATRVEVVLAATDEARATALRQVFLRDGQFEKALRRELESIDCPIPDGLQVSITTVSEPLPHAADFRLVLGSAEKSPFHWRLQISTGESVDIVQTRTNLGRASEANKKHSRGRRFNHISLDHPAVSRDHAHMELDDKTGRLLLFQDNPRNYTGVIRSGCEHQVSATGCGFQLQPGDCMVLGVVQIPVELAEDSASIGRAG
jgi:hypothetical protein